MATDLPPGWKVKEKTNGRPIYEYKSKRPGVGPYTARTVAEAWRRHGNRYLKPGGDSKLSSGVKSRRSGSRSRSRSSGRGSNRSRSRSSGRGSNRGSNRSRSRSSGRGSNRSRSSGRSSGRGSNSGSRSPNRRRWRGAARCPKPVNGRCRSPCGIYKTMRRTVRLDNGKEVKATAEFCARTSGRSPKGTRKPRALLERHKELWRALVPDHEDEMPTMRSVSAVADVLKSLGNLKSARGREREAKMQDVEDALQHVQDVAATMSRRVGMADNDGVDPDASVRISSYDRKKDARKYEQALTEATASAMCNSRSVLVLEDGDWRQSLKVADGLFVAKKGGVPVGFLLYLLPDKRAFPAQWNRMQFEKNSKRIMASDAADEMRALLREKGATVADSAPILEILVACKRGRGTTAEDAVMTKLLDRARKLVGRQGLFYAGATKGAGNGPTRAWAKMGFEHVTRVRARDGDYEQDVMVRKAYAS